jgi:hypothetical protein
VPGDYNGDGTSDVAVFRPSNGVWYVHNGRTAAWGTQAEVPLPLAPSLG